MISIIIPVLNEAHQLPTTLANLQGNALEIIVVDGGSQDNSAQVAKNSGARLITSPPGRARQMNMGASQATGDILIFLHGDTILPPDFAPLVQQTLGQPQVAAGAFSLQLQGCWWGLKLISRGANIRSRFFKLPYGDQAIFLRATTFHQAGGFPEQAIMEDFCLIRRLARLGNIVTLPQEVISSGRRWQQRGFLATIINQLIIIGFFLGLPTDLLAKFYRGVKHL